MKVIAYQISEHTVFLTHRTVSFPFGIFGSFIGFFSEAQAEETFEAMTSEHIDRVGTDRNRWKPEDIASKKLGIYEANATGFRMVREVYDRIRVLNGPELSAEGHELTLKEKEGVRLLTESVQQQIDRSGLYAEG